MSERRSAIENVIRVPQDRHGLAVVQNVRSAAGGEERREARHRTWRLAFSEDGRRAFDYLEPRLCCRRSVIASTGMRLSESCTYQYLLLTLVRLRWIAKPRLPGRAPSADLGSSRGAVLVTGPVLVGHFCTTVCGSASTVVTPVII